MMRNTKDTYGWLARSLHWLIALAAIGLFGLGLYMVELTYYDANYQTFPHWHKSIGILVVITMVARLLWRLFTITPDPVAGGKPWEHKVATLVHFVLYALPFALIISGYLISTADGRSISVFDLFEVPALFPAVKGMEDIAGLTHEIIAWSLAGIVVLHAFAALKHHFIDKDRTLLRMIKETN